MQIRLPTYRPPNRPSDYKVSKRTEHMYTFLVACTQLYKLLCRLVGPSIHFFVTQCQLRPKGYSPCATPVIDAVVYKVYSIQ